MTQQIKKGAIRAFSCKGTYGLYEDKLYNSDSLLIILFSLLRDIVTDYSLIMSLYVWNLILTYI